MDQILEKLKNKQDLTFEESKATFEILMTGKASDDEIFDFVALLSEKDEVSDKLACLLDTSPSPRVATLSRMPSSA